MSDLSKATPEPFRLPDGDLDRLGSEPATAPTAPLPTINAPAAEATNAEPADGPTSVFILALGARRTPPSWPHSATA